MTQAQRFKITVSAEDKASEIFAKVNRTIGDLSKPAAGAEQAFKRIADSAALDTIGKSLQSIGGYAKVALAGIAGFVGISSLGSAANFIHSMLGGMADLSRQAAAIGVNVEKLQELQGAYRRVGGTAEGMTEQIRSLAREMRNAVVGENDLALALATQYGISLKRLEDGSFDVEAALMRIADVYKRILRENGPQSADAFARAFGLENLGLLLREGSSGLQKLMGEFRDTGAVMKEEAGEGAREYERALVELEDRATGLANAIGRSLRPAMTNLFKGTSQLIKYPMLLTPGWKFGAGIYKPPQQRGSDVVVIPLRPSAARRPGAAPAAAAAAAANQPNFTQPDKRFDELTTEDFLEAAKRKPIATAHSGSVHVDINLRGAPPGTVANVRSQGPVKASTRVETTMPGYGP